MKLENTLSPHLETVMDHFRTKGCEAAVVKTGYEFQKGANEMLRITKA